MMLKSVILLAFSTVALAHPGKRQVHTHHHHKWGTGTEGFAAPTDGAFSKNSTGGGAFGAGPSSVATSVVTQTVIPIAATSASASSAGGEFFAAPSSSPVAPEAAEVAASSSCSSTMTSTYTSIDYVTMTISSGTTTSTIPVGGNAQAFQESTAPAAMTASSSSVSDAPAGFFQKSSISFGGFSSAAGVSTTMATMFSSAASVSAASVPPASSSSAPSTGGPSGGKKGLSYNSAALTSAFANSGMSWAYNWGSSASGTLPSGVSYVPMLWGLTDLDSWADAAASAISAGSTAALSFNEPDLSSQSNIDPGTAATNHIQYMNPLSVEVGSPAITNGAGTDPLMGIDWLNAFFAACDGKCKVDFVAFHWYNDASQTDDFETHVNAVIAAAAAAGVSKVWLTEFGVTGGDASTFLSTVMPFLESTPAVEKYAFFMCADPQTLSGSTLNTVGDVYASTS